ncbi:hypothetical protein LC613_33810 [Nostoc sphaeroides CHAB 2801]|nr:hypothetical protein [Nostoc sphaeroides]MCC5632590.1 hypothetical protein [Nostoc sphaeroides CHAB 2801]
MPAVLASLRISRLRENENLEDAPSAEASGGVEAAVFDCCGGEVVGFD